MKRRSNTKQQPSKPPYFLDESISGPTLRKRLLEAGIPALEYETLFRRHRVPDASVFESATASGYIVVGKDLAMETDELESLIKSKTRLVLLVDKNGGVFNWIAALVCSHEACLQVLQECPVGPLVIRVAKSGAITKFRGEVELRQRFLRSQTAEIVRAKRHGNVSAKTAG